MAFCRYCGRKLEDGEVCNCRDTAAAPNTTQQDVQPPQQEFQPSQPWGAPPYQETQTTQQPWGAPTQQGAQPSQQGGTPVQPEVKPAQPAIQWGPLARTALKDFVNLLKSPANYSAPYVRGKNLITSLAFFLLHAICAGIFSMFLVGRINGLIGLGGSYTAGMAFSSIGAFFLTLLYSIILSVVLTALYFCGVKLLKGQIDLYEAFSIVSMRSVIAIPIALLSCLVFLLNITAGLVFYYLVGAIAGVAFLFAGSQNIVGISKDRRLYLCMSIIIVFTIFFILFASWVLPSYIPSSIRGLFSLESILGSL